MKLISIDEVIYSNGSGASSINNYAAWLFFNYKKHIYETSGVNRYNVECWAIIKDTIEINYFDLVEDETIKLPFEIFKNRYPDFKSEIVPYYNCHGYSLFKGDYFVNPEEATKIFADEYEECEEKECEIVIFRNKAQKIIAHSGIYNQETSMIFHKPGIQPLETQGTIDNILSIPEYCETVPLYIKRI